MVKLLFLILLLGACGQPNGLLSDDPTTDVTADPNTHITWNLELGAEELLVIKPEVGATYLFDMYEVCRLKPDWTIERHVETEGLSCEEYSKLLSSKLMGHTGFAADYFPYLALCWLLDPCLKGQP